MDASLIAGRLAGAVALGRRAKRASTLLAAGGLALLLLGAQAQAGEACPSSADAIATDRPDVTNSSLVVPIGSLQVENGINVTSGQGTRIVDGTNTRMRLGIADCTEILVDLPTAFRPVKGNALFGASDLAPAVKRQLFAGVFSLSGVVGLGLPTGDKRIVGRGYQPYLQAPWSQELSGSWSLNGMLTATFLPSEPKADPTLQSTVALERELGERADAFIEYIGDFAAHDAAIHRFNSGAAYRLTPYQQIDFHAGIGLSRDAPDWFVGVGYSFRFDGLF
jgi:Putative MetA-pathway of phenol degradation